MSVCRHTDSTGLDSFGTCWSSATRLLEICKPSAARLGGDDFAIPLPEADIAAASLAAEKDGRRSGGTRFAGGTGGVNRGEH